MDPHSDSSARLLSFRTILGSSTSPPPQVKCMLGKCDQSFPWLDSCVETGAGLDGRATREDFLFVERSQLPSNPVITILNTHTHAETRGRRLTV